MSDTPHDARLQSQLADFDALAALAMGMAKDVAAACAAQAQAGGLDHEASNGYALALARVARAVRQTHALGARLIKDSEAAQVERAKRLKREAQDRLDDHVEQVRDKVERAIEAHASGDDADELSDELNEWLADAADDDDFIDRPVAEIVAAICKDLQVPVPDAWLRPEAVDDAADDDEAEPPAGWTVIGGPPHPGRRADPTPANPGIPRSAEATPPHIHRLE